MLAAGCLKDDEGCLSFNMLALIWQGLWTCRLIEGSSPSILDLMELFARLRTSILNAGSMNAFLQWW